MYAWGSWRMRLRSTKRKRRQLRSSDDAMPPKKHDADTINHHGYAVALPDNHAGPDDDYDVHDHHDDEPVRHVLHVGCRRNRSVAFLAADVQRMPIRLRLLCATDRSVRRMRDGADGLLADDQHDDSADYHDADADDHDDQQQHDDGDAYYDGGAEHDDDCMRRKLRDVLYELRGRNMGEC